MPSNVAWIAIAASVAAAFCLAATQSYLNARIGTDHAVHGFLIRAIRANNYRFFVRVPGLLNETYCAALPLYLHWILAWLPNSIMYRAERLLNPAVNALHIALFAGLAWIAARQSDGDPSVAAIIAALFAFTPQFYHALSARDFGLSARGIGLLLLSVFFFATYRLEVEAAGISAWVLLATSAYLIWAFSTFGAQAMVILAVLLLGFGRVVPLTGAGLGLLIFVAVHPRYSLGYLRHTLAFIHRYATELAAVYILSRRHSIWRDLVVDIWSAIAADRQRGLRYAYENSILIVVLLNPLLILTAVGALTGQSPGADIFGFATDVALAGLTATLLTSFRRTRFLGEPERYAEAVTPWATLAGGAYLITLAGEGGAWLVVIAFALFTLGQLAASRMLARHIANKPYAVEPVVAASAKIGEPIRCCSNNEQVTKLLFPNDWAFAYCMAVGPLYAGMTVSEVFSNYPAMSRRGCQRIVETYRINFCILDRNLYDTLFDVPPAGLRGIRTIYQSAGLRALALDWEPEPPGRRP